MPRGKALASHALIPVHVVLPPNADAVDTFVFTAVGNYEVMGVTEVHDTKGTDGSDVTLDVKKCPSGTSVASGTSVLASTFSLKSDADTPVKKTISNGGIAASPTRIVTDGQTLALDITGTATAVAGVAVTIWLKPLSRPSF